MNVEAIRKLNEISADAKRMFSFPHELVDDPSFNVSQKRSLLAEWASDACAIESLPTLRLLPGTTFPVTFSSIMDALAQLDRLRAKKNEKVGRARQHDSGKGAAKRRATYVPHPFAGTASDTPQTQLAS
jgi:hypothetical protein